MKRGGFTLVEVIFAMLLIGIAIASLLSANSSFTKANGAGMELSTAEFMVEQIRELTTMLDYDSLHDFDGVSFSPPINASEQSLTNFPQFSQQITVENVSAADLTAVVADHSSDLVRVTVEVFINSTKISSVSWIRADY